MNPVQGEIILCFLTISVDSAECPVNAVLHLLSNGFSPSWLELICVGSQLSSSKKIKCPLKEKVLQGLICTVAAAESIEDVCSGLTITSACLGNSWKLFLNEA